MFAGAKPSYATMSIAEGMETALLNMWRGEKQLSEDAVFKLLKLDEEGDKLFQNPLVNTWASYVKMLGTGSDKSVFLTLRARYGEGDLAQMLLTKSKSTGSLAARLEYAQRNSWMTERKTADDIFKLLNVQKQNENLLVSPVFSSWTSCVAGVERGSSDEVVMSVLRTHYDGKTLASMLDIGKGNPSTKSVATRLQEELWLSEGKGAEDIFKLLKLDASGDDVFTNPELAAWVSYVMKVNKRGKNADEFLAIALLVDKIGEGDQLELAMRLSAARIRNVRDESLADLQKLQFKQWRTEGETPASISDRITTRGFDSRSTGVLLSYHDFYKANRKITS